MRVHEPRSTHFKPFPISFHINFHRWLGERKETGAKTNFNFFIIKKLSEKIKQCPFQLRERNFFIYIQSFYLVKLRFVSCISRFIAKHLPRHDNPIWWLDSFF